MKRINCSRGWKWLSGRASMLCLSILLPFCLFTFSPLLTSCSVIDEDLDDCGEQATVNYELELITNMSIELRTQLNAESEKNVAESLKNYLKNIFADFAHDADLSFYDTKGDSVRLHHEQHIMEANQEVYTLYLPKLDYMHLAAANLADNSMVSLTDDDFCHPAKLQQQQMDTISSHNTGLFTARQPMSLKVDKDQTFNVKLYMANCAVALVVDPHGYDVQGMTVLTSGFASGFNINDSTFTFGGKPFVVKADELEVKNKSHLCFCSVNFPSREPNQTRTVIETEEPFISQPGEESLWEFQVYVPNHAAGKTRAETSFTKTTLQVREPIRAGELKIIECQAREDGSVVTASPEVGVSVTLDWKPGNTYHPEI